jgi:hypothetical protein
MNLFTTMQVGDREMDLASWGIRRCNREVNNQASDSFGFDLQAQFDAPDLFPYETKIIIRRQRQATLAPGQLAPATNSFKAGTGTIFFVGYRKQHIRMGSGRMEQFKYKFGGPWEMFFELHEYQQPWYWLLNKNGVITVQSMFYSTQIVLGQSSTLLILPNGVQTTQETMAQAMISAAQWTQGVTTNQYGSPQFQIDTALPTSNFDGVGGWEGYFPMQAANDITTAEAIRKVLQYVPQSSAWFDCSTTGFSSTGATTDLPPLPTFRANTRDTAPSVTLPLTMGMGVKPNIERRDDLVPICIDYKYRVRSTLNGQTTETLIDDIACPAGTVTAASGNVPQNILQYSTYIGAVLGTFDFTGANETIVNLNVQPIPFSVNAYNQEIWQSILCGALNDSSITTVSFASDAVTGWPYPAVLTNPDGSVADGRYVYYLVGGPAPAGLVDKLNPNLAQGVQLQLSQAFTFTENATAGSIAAGNNQNLGPTSIKTERKSVSIYAYSMPPGSYVINYVPSELIPAGLANFVYQIETKPQYQGTWTVTEQDITDVCPMGTNLNISGGLPEWETMNAQVQQISYDLMAGTTTLTFGPAKHLGGDDFIQRIRVNRGPRWLYLIGNNTSGGVNNNAAVSGPTQLKDTQGAAQMQSWLWMTGPTPTKDSGGNPIGIVQDKTPTSPAGGQVTVYSGVTGVTPPAKAALAANNIKIGIIKSDGTMSGQYIYISVVDLKTIIDSAVTAGTTPSTPSDQTLSLHALETCETPASGAPSGAKVYRIFPCSPPITVVGTWTTPL